MFCSMFCGGSNKDTKKKRKFEPQDESKDVDEFVVNHERIQGIESMVNKKNIHKNKNNTNDSSTVTGRTTTGTSSSGGGGNNGNNDETTTTDRKRRGSIIDKRNANIMMEEMKLCSEAKKSPKTEEERKFLEETLHKSFIFAELGETSHELIIDYMEKATFHEGDVIVTQGVPCDYFHIVYDGTIGFVLDQEGSNDHCSVGHCTRGGTFGEMSLFYEAPPNASCVVDSTTCTLWRVDRCTFRSLVVGEAHAKEHRMKKWLQSIPLFASSLDDDKLTKLSNALKPVKFFKNDRIVQKGDVGNVFYIIESGEVLVHGIGLGDSQSNDQTLTRGDWFGERALLTGEPRAAHITAISDTVYLQAIGRETFEKICGYLQDVMEHEMKKRFLQSTAIFANSQSILRTEMDQFVTALTELCYRKESKVFKQNPGLYIIRSGKVAIYKPNGDIYNLKSGDYFGGVKRLKPHEQEQLDRTTVICEENTTCWVLSRDDVERIMGGNTQRLGSSAPFISSKRIPSIRKRDLTVHRVLGKGAFGHVWLVSYDQTKQKRDSMTASKTATNNNNIDNNNSSSNNNNENNINDKNNNNNNNTYSADPKQFPYALKMVNKRECIESNSQEGMIREKDLLSKLDHPFILGLISSFQDRHFLYLLLEFIQGGELFTVIHCKANKGKGISNEMSIFYASCIVDALGHFHERRICYRDLKPENVLIDQEGYAIVVDLGFAKIVPIKTYTLCGTPEYLAPETILCKGHNHCVDYWALGILIYEMLLGKSTFYHPRLDQMSMFKKILQGDYSIPHDVLTAKHVPDSITDLLQQLLEKNPVQRLGNLSNGYKDIQNHPWFQSMDWKQLIDKQLPAPWIPKVQDPFGLQQQEDEAIDFLDQLRDAKNEPPLSEREQKFFKGF